MASIYKTFTSGSVLTATELQSYLMDQSVIVCDSSADYPSVPKEGMVVYDKALDAALMYTASAWVRIVPLTTSAVQTWTPTVTQSAAVSHTVNSARYVRQGCLVTAWANLTMTGSGTTSNAIRVSLPVTAAGHATTDALGSGAVYDTGTATYSCSVQLNSNLTEVIFATDAGSVVGTSPAFALATNDVIRFTVTYTV